ncbi:hypothetical protein VE03_02226 [Pseudogymnoascus sp. 23342-1-I1]|nr:hypothetical protein VE03_02226 [Pseudogymnoascus sp. 23342-1-I1]
MAHVHFTAELGIHSFLCQIVSGVISPTPEAAICGGSGSSYSLEGTGTVINYSAGSPYVASLAACSAKCVATATCSAIYFIQGRYCNLKYGPRAFLSGVGNPPFAFYEASCFKCATSSTAITSKPSSTVSTVSSTTTSTTASTSAACGIISGQAAPTPAGAICGVKGSSHAMPDTGTIISYRNGSPYVADIATCGAQCLATSCCTSVYFIQGQYCNLKYGPNAFSANIGNPPLDFYEASCFTCGRLSCSTSTTAYNTELTTTFTQPAQCSRGVVTQMAYSGNGIWKNAIIPVPTSTITSCFPTQFADSVIARAVSSTILPPFAKLVCPKDWESTYFNSTYLICCPPNFGPYLPNRDSVDRPGLDALCTSSIVRNVLMDISSYDLTAFATVIVTSAPTYGVLVLADAFDGTALHPRPT